jgi:hypothetical protein
MIDRGHGSGDLSDFFIGEFRKYLCRGLLTQTDKQNGDSIESGKSFEAHCFLTFLDPVLDDKGSRYLILLNLPAQGDNRFIHGERRFNRFFGNLKVLFLF